MTNSSAFLTAEWRKLAIANYLVDKNILSKYLPYKTELDTWDGACYVSLVGFMFMNTRLKGMMIPFHKNFEEVNLRFYVRHNSNGIWKRGVTFIKEIVPKPSLAFIANSIYKENYETMQMKHYWQISSDCLEVCYQWKKDSWNTFEVKADTKEMQIEAGSEEEFITEHYWGYTKIKENKTSEYEVAHPVWTTYAVKDYSINVDFNKVYGEDFSFLSGDKPKSVMLAEGSDIVVKKSKIISHL